MIFKTIISKGKEVYLNKFYLKEQRNFLRIHSF